tara:strand:- start:71 stop:436 length:366 start_codon:yes stop_codon:yes gene_type:complete
MELTAFKTMPDELIRLIMEYARPTYPYLVEIKLANKERTTRFRRCPLTSYLNTEHHMRCFINYRIYREYEYIYANYINYDVVGELNEVMSEIEHEDGSEPSVREILNNVNWEQYFALHFGI